jgi:hypothetical protein
MMILTQTLLLEFFRIITPYIPEQRIKRNNIFQDKRGKPRGGNPLTTAIASHHHRVYKVSGGTSSILT